MKQKLDKIIILINILILLLLCCNNNNIVYAESPGAFSSALHDENHPETQIIEGEVIDTGAVNSNGDKSLEKVEQEDYEKYKEAKKTGMGPFFPATKEELEAAKNAPTDPEEAKAKSAEDPWKAFVPGYENIISNYGEMTGKSLLRGRQPDVISGRPE